MNIKTDYGDSETDDEVDDTNEQYAYRHITYKSYEYICMTYHNNLKQKEPKMPAQAYANDLLLSPVPHELQNLTNLECKLIALCIPFWWYFACFIMVIIIKSEADVQMFQPH